MMIERIGLSPHPWHGRKPSMTLAPIRRAPRRAPSGAAPTNSSPVFEAEYVGGEIVNLAPAQVQIGHPAVWCL